MTPEDLELISIIAADVANCEPDCATISRILLECRAEIERLQSEVAAQKVAIASYIDDAVLLENRTEAAEARETILRRLVELADEMMEQFPVGISKVCGHEMAAEYDLLTAQLKEMTK